MRIPLCYKYGLEGDIKPNCPRPPVKAKMKDGEKIAGAPLLVEVEEVESKATQ